MLVGDWPGGHVPAVGDIVRAEVVDTEGVDLIARVVEVLP